MDKKNILKTIEDLKQISNRGFNQTFDLVINLQGLDFKKPEHQIDFFMSIPHQFKKKKICALVGSELAEDAKKACDYLVVQEEFDKYKDKKLIKKLVREFDFFIAQGNMMGPIATTFGRTLGPKGKMPNPKAGAIVQPKGNIKNIYDKLQGTLKISTKSLVLHCPVGKQDTDPEKIADNVLAVYDTLIHHLPNHKNNVRNALLKLTMSKPIKLEL